MTYYCGVLDYRDLSPQYMSFFPGFFTFLDMTFSTSPKTISRMTPGTLQGDSSPCQKVVQGDLW